MASCELEQSIAKPFKEERANGDGKRFTTSSYNGLGDVMPLQ